MHAASPSSCDRLGHDFARSECVGASALGSSVCFSSSPQIVTITGNGLSTMAGLNQIRFKVVNAHLA